MSRIHSSTSSNSFFLVALCSRNVLLQILDTACRNREDKALVPHLDRFNLRDYLIVGGNPAGGIQLGDKKNSTQKSDGKCRLPDRIGGLNLLGLNIRQLRDGHTSGFCTNGRFATSHSLAVGYRARAGRALYGTLHPFDFM